MAALPVPPGIANGALQVEIDQAYPPHAPVAIGGIVPMNVVVENNERLQCLSKFVGHGITINEKGAEMLHQHELEHQALGGKALTL